MGIGPVLDCPQELNQNLSSLMALEHIKTKRIPVVSSRNHGSVHFRRGLARIVGRLRDVEGRTLMWLTAPGTHAFNPLFWYFDHRLSQQIESVLVRNGARQTDFGAFEDHSEPPEFAHSGNHSLFGYFSKNSRWDVVAQQYETRTHPDLAEILFDLAPSSVVRKGYAYGRPVIANQVGLIFAWAGGNRDFFIRLPGDKVEAACRDGARYDPTYPPEWVNFYMSRLGPDWRTILQRWVMTSYEESLMPA